MANDPKLRFEPVYVERDGILEQGAELHDGEHGEKTLVGLLSTPLSHKLAYAEEMCDTGSWEHDD